MEYDNMNYMVVGIFFVNNKILICGIEFKKMNKIILIYYINNIFNEFIKGERNI